MPRKRILLVSPYHGGSHQAWAEGYQRLSDHTVDLLTLPARFWKWRMHGGAVTLGRRYNNEFAKAGSAPHLILATDMLDLTTFLALTRQRTFSIPTVIYMHENQLTYPLPLDRTTGPMRRQHGERDRHYGFINFSSMLVADKVIFNSRYHLESCLDALSPFLRHYPEYNEIDSIDLIKQKSQVHPVGIDFQRFGMLPFPFPDPALPPLIIWNQRLEYDKNPEAFFRSLASIAAEGIPFRVAICGERFGRQEKQWDADLLILGDRVIHNGYANESLYQQLLWDAAVTVSTAEHEYFGVSILEAIFTQTFPILPNRLSYPEIIPAAYHSTCFYSDFDELIQRLRWALNFPDAARSIARDMARHASRYDWRHVAGEYDHEFQTLMV